MELELAYTMETINKVSFMGRESSVGLMGQFTLVISLRTKLRAKAS